MREKNFDKAKIIRIVLLLLLDCLLIAFSNFFTLFTRMEFDFLSMQESGFLGNIIRYFPINLACSLLIFWVFGLYNSLWEYASPSEVLRILGAALTSSGLQYLGLHLLHRGPDKPIPTSYLILYFLFLAGCLCALRLSYRLLRSNLHRADKSTKQKRTMVIGAGDAGALAVREFQTSQHSLNNVLCIIDDNKGKWGNTLRGVPIVGGRDSILKSVERYKIEEIILAIPSLPSRQQHAILEICQLSKCSLRTLPGVYQLANGEVTIQKIRNVQIEDLLGRDSVNVDMESIGSFVKGKTVLVTGGGGSIGSELCRQLAKLQPRQLIIFDIYENNAYAIQMELRRAHPELNLTVLIGSVRDRKRMEDIFAAYRPELVYHAAAHKHVPLMEDSPAEAIKNNVFGTLNTAEMADKYGAQRFILISTDKAVNPTNVMGATKRICEMVIQMVGRRSKTEYVAVRFGNVLGSNGSVIPLFRQQIANGGPVTVTDPRVIRYFMTIPEAVSLVLQAGNYAQGGEIFILDMGQPVRIDDLARNMIRLSGFEPDVDIPIVYTGLRPGEKLFEELLLSGEGNRKTENDLIFIGKDEPFDDEALRKNLDVLYEAAIEGKELRGLILKIVPEYKIPVHSK